MKFVIDYFWCAYVCLVFQCASGVSREVLSKWREEARDVILGEAFFALCFILKNNTVRKYVSIIRDQMQNIFEGQIKKLVFIRRMAGFISAFYSLMSM